MSKADILARCTNRVSQHYACLKKTRNALIRAFIIIGIGMYTEMGVEKKLYIHINFPTSFVLAVKKKLKTICSGQ